MVWVRLDDHFDQNPKIASVGPAGIAMWVCGIAYCNRNLTDGFIPWAVARNLISFEWLSADTTGDEEKWPIERLASTSDLDTTEDYVMAYPMRGYNVIQMLLHARLWEEVANGYRIHDYTDFQPTKAEVEAERAAKQAAGRAGGQASAQARAQAKSNGVVSGRLTIVQAESKPDPVPDPVPDPSPSYEVEDAAAAARDEPFARTVRCWERATGTTVTPMTGDKLGVWLEKAGEEWTRDAIEEMGASGAKSMRYLDAILQRWLLEGREEPPRDDPTDAHDKRMAEFQRGIDRIEAAKARLR